VIRERIWCDKEGTVACYERDNSAVRKTVLAKKGLPSGKKNETQK